MDALKSLPALTVTSSVARSASPGAATGGDQPTDTYLPSFPASSAPLNIFPTRQQVLALCQPPADSRPDLSEQGPAPARSESTNEAIKNSIPGPVKMVVDGYTLPGTQTTIKPRFDNGGFLGGPTGVNVKVKF